MKLREISEEEFDNLPESKKILCHEIEYSHKYAFLSANHSVEPVLLCWRSEIVKPEIIDNEQSPLLWFGIDQQILALNKSDGRVALALLLPSNLLELRIIKNSVVLRTEFEIYSFNLSGLVQMIYNLPEISESIQIYSHVLRVTMIDGQSMDLQI